MNELQTSTATLIKPKTGKDLYSYQKGAIHKIFKSFENAPENYHLLYQLPTGGGKTVIFSEIVRQYLKHYNKKVVVLTHRIELLRQTSTMLTEFNVTNKVVNSTANLDDQGSYSCFVAMVETLNNRLNDDKLDISDIGLVIIDEAHYNSFNKELIVGETIKSLIENQFLAKAENISYNVGLTSLTMGTNGDYSVKSSEDLYNQSVMLGKLLEAYETNSKGKKTLIFNNGINTSWCVYNTFKSAGYPIAHLDNTANNKERKKILQWFKETPNAILTSVSILTTGFDEPTIESIILNRATKSLTLYYQMIGRGSRLLQDKSTFKVIDLGNNFYRFGLWGSNLDWQKIFHSPDYYMDKLLNDDEIESNFRYEMPEEIRAKFANSVEVYFDIKETYTKSVNRGESSKVVLERSMEQHARICIENSEDEYDALDLILLLGDDIDHRINKYTKCICRSTSNFVEWLKNDYRLKLRMYLRANYDRIYEEVYGYPPEDE
jgi:type I site-specific restriction endonuclease